MRGPNSLVSLFKLLCVLAPALGLAQVPASIGYQGRLLNADGTAVVGPQAITFSIYAAASGNAPPLWTEEQVIALTEGFYSTSLGVLKPLPTAVFDGSVRYLELSVGGAAMSPRQPIASVAYALVSQSVSGGPVNASSLTVANTPVVDASGRLNPATIAPGSVPRDRLDRDGLTTDVARGAPVNVTAGDLLGGGPTNEYADGSYWTTSTFPATLTVDLKGSYYFNQVTFEAAWRGDGRYIPTYSGTAAYVLEYSVDKATWTNIPSVAPVQGDVFIHRVGGLLRYLRLTVISPFTAGNPVNVSMFRVLSTTYGDSTRVDARRLYGGLTQTKKGELVPAPAGRVTGIVTATCDLGSTTTAVCEPWGTGTCAGSTAICTSKIGCTAGVLVRVSHGVCYSTAYDVKSYCHNYLCLE